ncbi:hypothetical protein [Methylocaldum gracile]|uniref:hypothetical protein n=1 Tax=unclassified Methylocaldum TaxID=2622260 RepID=UPI00105DE62F
MNLKRGLTELWSGSASVHPTQDRKYDAAKLSPVACWLLLSVLLTGCGNETMTLEEAKHQHYAVRVENVDFNVPLLYHPLEGSRVKGWTPPKPERETIDAIRIVALLPDLDFYNEKTAKEFKVLGYGKKSAHLNEPLPG